MTIEYLQSLRDNPNASGYRFTNEAIELSEIEQLEAQHNNGNPFPKALRELLYLAGEYCYIFDYGWTTEGMTSQASMQQDVHDAIIRRNPPPLPRPYYVIETRDAGTHFQFVFLDEGDKPYVYNGSTRLLPIATPTYYMNTGKTLKEFVDNSVDRQSRGLY